MADNEEVVYSGHGIIVYGFDRVGISHDLDDEHVQEVRKKILTEIEGSLLRAAPGAARIGKLQEAKRVVEKFLLTRAEDYQRRRISAEKLLPLAKRTGPKQHDALNRLLNDVRIAFPGIVNKNDALSDTLSAAERKHLQVLLAEYQSNWDAAEIEEKKKWVEQYGSDRIKGLIREGIAWDSVYFQERFEKERPNWKLEQSICGEIVDPKGPSVTAEHFAALGHIRKAVQDAKLGWISDAGHVEECDCWNHEVNERMVIHSPFLGKNALIEMSDVRFRDCEAMPPEEDIPF